MSGSTHTQRKVELTRIEVGVLGNCRSVLRGIDELAADIDERGLLQPLLVWHKRMKRSAHVLPDGREVWDRYILIAGHRRLAAIEKIREDDPEAFEVVPVTLFHVNQDDALFAQIAENLQREDLMLSDLANAIYMMRGRDHTQAVIAKRLGRSQAFVSRVLKLRQDAAKELLEAVSQGEIPMETAMELLDFDEKEQLRMLAKYRRRVAEVGKKGASREIKKSTGKPVRASVSTLKKRHTFLAEARRQATKETKPAFRLAESLLAWALGAGPWPEELPAPEESPKS